MGAKTTKANDGRHRLIAAGLASLALLATAGVVTADPQEFTVGETLTAAKLNANFADLNVRFDMLAAAVPAMTAWAPYDVPLSSTSGGASFQPDNGDADTGHFRRVGDSIEIIVNIRFLSCDATGPLLFSLPPPLVVDTEKTGTLAAVGSGYLRNGPAATTQAAWVVPSATETGVHLGTSGSDAVTCADIGANGFVRVRFSVPVEGWGVTE